MKVLELYCGTKSFSKECEKVGWECTTVDNRSAFDPTILVDVLTWDYTTLPPIDILWAGIPCTKFSIASSCRDPEGGNVLALKTLEILKHFQELNPNLIYGFENPWSSLLKKQSFMQDIPWKKCDYCQYGSRDEDNMGYKKATIIWGNIPWTPKLCPGKGLCPEMVGSYHKEVAQHGIQKGTPPGIQKRNFTQTQLYRMPPKLCRDLVEAIRAGSLV
jgi:hypothetical protein